MARYWKIIAGGLLVIVVPFLTASETSIKALVASWFRDCRLIIEKSSAEAVDGSLRFELPVVLYVSGTSAPNEIRLGFSTAKPVLEKVVLIRDLASSNLAVHPDAGQTCPDVLCDEEPAGGVGVGDATLFRDLKLRIRHFSNVFDYSFRVRMILEDKGDPPEVNVYVHYKEIDVGPSKTVCLVEEASVFNLLARVGAWAKFFILAGFLLPLTLVAAWLRSLATS